MAWVLFAFQSPVYAATPWAGCLYSTTIQNSNGTTTQINDVAQIQCLVPLFQNAVIAIMQLAGVALFLMFIVGGFQFITSGGNPKQLEQARGTLTYAIIGVIVIVCAYLILKLIQAITGVDVTIFNVPGA